MRPWRWVRDGAEFIVEVEYVVELACHRSRWCGGEYSEFQYMAHMNLPGLLAAGYLQLAVDTVLTQFDLGADLR